MPYTLIVSDTYLSYKSWCDKHGCRTFGPAVRYVIDYSDLYVCPAQDIELIFLEPCDSKAYKLHNVLTRLLDQGASIHYEVL